MKPNEDGIIFDIYRGWTLRQIPLGEGLIKVIGTKYPDWRDMRSPVVHKDFRFSDREAQVMAIRKVREKIDEIENEGFDHYVARNLKAS